VLVASTGVIGMQVPIDRISNGVKLLSGCLGSSSEAATDAAKAIMTTDTREKTAAVRFAIGGKDVTIGGMCKGSGMIHPDMCTMLCFLTTDADIAKELLQQALSDVTQSTFNMVSVDKDTSTNDTVLLLANAAAGNSPINAVDNNYNVFKNALHIVMNKLARMVACDGEGATKLLEVTVRTAANENQAKQLAKSVICSPLVKTALFGADANWGRIMCALGYAGVDFNQENVDIYLRETTDEDDPFYSGLSGQIGTLQDFSKTENNKLYRIVGGGKASDYSEEKAKIILSQKVVSFIIDMNMGDTQATAWGCDLSYEYVKINGDYRS
jgi:glutamate N-acetyltransferase/amino-acid N-acetyltransferase